MPQWFTAFLALSIMCVVGVYMVHGVEGFTAQNACRTALAACQSGCKDAACFTKCLDTNTKCSADAVAAQSVAITTNTQGPFMNSALVWAQGQANSSSVVPNYSAKLASFSSTPASASASPTSAPTYTTDLGAVYHTPVSSSPWDANRTIYASGWKQASPSTHVDGSYEAIPSQASYTPSVKKWKPHETPTPESTGLAINAPTDAGTFASSVTPMPSLQQLIRKDAKDTVNAIFNEYEIQYK